ncbi:MAG: FecR/PupR family sigma factor regulator [Pseudomonadota bacterium]|jgi:transmembrane sensor
MSKIVNPKQDPVWDVAWSWVLRQHEGEGFGAGDEAELAHWLAADPTHRDTYEKACRLWLMAGLVPPVSDIHIPGCHESDSEPQR